MVKKLEYSENRERWVTKEKKQFASKKQVKKFLNLDKSTNKIKTNKKYEPKSEPTKEPTKEPTETEEPAKEPIKKTTTKKTDKDEEFGLEPEKIKEEPKFGGKLGDKPILQLDNVEVETDNEFGEINESLYKPLNELAKKIQVGWKNNGAKDFRYIATEKTEKILNNVKKGQFLSTEKAKEIREKRRMRRSVKSLMRKNNISQDEAMQDLNKLFEKEKELKRKGYSPEKIEDKIRKYKRETLGWKGYSGVIYIA